MSIHSTTSPNEPIKSVLRDYFQGYLTADSRLVAKAFHPDARLFCIEEGKLEKTELSEWLTNLNDRQIRGDVRSADIQVISVDQTDTAATAKVVLTFPKFRFTDYLSLLQIEGHWRIIGKIYALQELNPK